MINEIGNIQINIWSVFCSYHHIVLSDTKHYSIRSAQKNIKVRINSDDEQHVDEMSEK